MATVSKIITDRDYPTSDGKPMAETPAHQQVMIDLIQILRDRYETRDDVYVAGNMLMFYEQGKPRKHVSPDVFVSFGIPKLEYENYLIWRVGKGPDFIVEVTSKSTRNEDQKKKLVLYRDVLRVLEYFLFDPLGDYLKPPLQGYRLVDGDYEPIEAIDSRLPSELLGLHLERSGSSLRLYDPATGLWIPTVVERTREERERARQADEARRREVEARQIAEENARREAEARRREAEARQIAEENARREAEARQIAEENARRVQAERDHQSVEIERLKRLLAEAERKH
jgi:Uma2 family endonuclease